MGPYPRDDVDETAAVPETRAERRERATADTRASILAAARERLLAVGYANLSTRTVAEAAEVPLSQIHYHFGSRQQLILAVLEAENERLLERQRTMYAGPEPLWRQWERACDYLEEDVKSGYVRVLQEMVAAGWSDAEVAAEVREYLGGWYRLLTEVAEREGRRGAGLGPFEPAEVAALMGLPFMGAEAMILLGMPDSVVPTRSALRKLGFVIRRFEEERTDDGGGTPMTNDLAIAHPAVSTADEAAIRGTIDDYYLGWYDADGERMARALHPDLAKRGWLRAPDGAAFVDLDTFATMTSLAAAGHGRRTEAMGRAYDVRSTTWTATSRLPSCTPSPTWTTCTSFGRATAGAS